MPKHAKNKRARKSRHGALRYLAAGTLLALSVSSRADLPAAAKYSGKHGETALLVWENGRMRFERQKTSLATANAFSITKSLAALGVLNAVARGILDLDERVSRTIPSWRSDERKSRITVRDLLGQTSGLSPGYETLYSDRVRDKSSAALKLPAVSGPGSTFAYGPSHYEALEALMAKKSPRPSQVWLALPHTKVKPDRFRKDALGHPYFSAGAQLSPKQFLELGQIVEHRGRAGLFPVIPPALIGEATTGSEANPMYGLGFWLNSNARKPSAVDRDIEQAIRAGLSKDQWGKSCLSKDAPADLVAMVGSRGQRVYVVPSRNQVIVRLGNASTFRDPEFLRALYQ